MHYTVMLFSKYDCFLCEFYKWVKSLFVYEEPSTGSKIRVVTETSPVEHFTLYHSVLLTILLSLAIGIALILLIRWGAKDDQPKVAAESEEPPALSQASAPITASAHTDTVTVTLYNFKSDCISLGAEYFPDIPTRDGYAFTGWFYDPSFTKPFMPGKKIKKDITLYPRWNKE